jgi:hypothetical protein
MQLRPCTLFQVASVFFFFFLVPIIVVGGQHLSYLSIPVLPMSRYVKSSCLSGDDGVNWWMSLNPHRDPHTNMEMRYREHGSDYFTQFKEKIRQILKKCESSFKHV